MPYSPHREIVSPIPPTRKYHVLFPREEIACPILPCQEIVHPIPLKPYTYTYRIRTCGYVIGANRLSLSFSMVSLSSLKSSLVPTRMMGVLGQWWLTSGYHFVRTFSYEAGLTSEKQMRNTSCGVAEKISKMGLFQSHTHLIGTFCAYVLVRGGTHQREANEKYILWVWQRR